MSEVPTDLPPRLMAAATYVLEGEYACHECGCIVPVFGLMPVGPFDRQGDMLLDEDDDSALLRRPLNLPPDIRSTLASRSGGSFHPDDSKTLGERYWMNHCRDCGTKIGDWFVHKPGGSLLPDLRRGDQQAPGLQGHRTPHLRWSRSRLVVMDQFVARDEAIK